MKDKYKIENAYPGKHNDKYGEIEISSYGLLYIEMCDTHSGCQSVNLENNDLIHSKCREISKLIKELDELNQI